MKESYLNELERLLDEKNVSGKDEILEKYRKFYDLGLEAGLSPEEIEEKLGSPQDLVNKYTVEKNERKQSEKKELHISLVSDDLEIRHEDVEEIEITLEKCNKDNYRIEKTENGLVIEALNSKSLFKKSGNIYVTIPTSLSFKDIDISIVSGDTLIDELYCDKFNMSVTSGDVDASKIVATTSIKINTVSGDFNTKDISTSDIVLNTVSGDINIKKLNAKNLKASTVTGDIIIKDSTTITKEASTVTGDVIINNIKEAKSISDMLKGWGK